jgi:nitrite reductase (NO-forming)
LRVVLVNTGLVVCLLPVPGEVRVLVGVLVLAAFAAFLPLLVSAVLYAVGAKRLALQRPKDPAALTKHVPEAAAITRERHTRQALAGLALIVLAMAAGYALAG